jgi:NAD(P)-dependent dehydrogenase (short-subunit alcohol dehydrogenase family)
MSEANGCCLVTGAGAGMGREIARAIARRGRPVVIADIDAGALNGTAELIESVGGLVVRAALDLTQDGAAAQVVARAIENYGRLDVLINNAGYGAIEPFLDMTAAIWDRTWSINVKALALLTAAAGRAMRARRGGRIVNITSPASRMALPNYAAYAASKAAVDSITRSAAVALAPYGITVNSVAPGMMDTAMQRTTEAQLAAVEGRFDLAAFLDERTRRIPLGRRAEIPEVVEVVLWLAFDAPSYVTAERLNASGGLDRD